MEALAANAALSLGGAWLAAYLLREFFPIFIRRNHYGKDRCKRQPVDENGREQPIKVPEPMGVIMATVYLVVMFLFLPIPFYGWLSRSESEFPYQYFVEFLSGLTAICCMILLGFADDMFDLRWRHKLLLPSLASLPLLMVYAANSNSTSVLLPKQITALTGLSVIDIGVMYYLYMGMLAVFCTNAINILAGVNGLEAGQSLIIASSIILYNAIQLWRAFFCFHSQSIFEPLHYIKTYLERRRREREEKVEKPKKAKKRMADAGGKLKTEPEEAVEFTGTWEEPVNTEMKINNSSGARLAYKVKCTSNELFKIRPVVGILGDGESATVTLTFSPKDKTAPAASHHFTLTEFAPKEEETNARKVWEADDAKKTPASKRIKAQFKSNAPAAPDAAPAAPADAPAPPPEDQK